MLWSRLSEAARAATEAGDAAKAKVLWLLADACSMTLKAEDRFAPFKPFAVFEDGRSAVPEDFDEEALRLFADALAEIDDARVRARLADLLWLLESPRNPEHARIAIDAYRHVPINAEAWVRGGRECWRRAISLAQTLQSGAGERLSEMEAVVVGELLAVASGQSYLRFWLAQVLSDAGLGRERARDIATALEEAARLADTAGEIHRARDYFDASREWFQLCGDKGAEFAATIAVAETWAREALGRQAAAQPSNMVAAGSLEKAVQVYRTIPRAERVTRGIDARIEELRRLLTEAGERSLDEMGVVTSGPIDITELLT